jgi:uncharacterized protein YbcC (UPF0753/DUF2309 family)
MSLALYKTAHDPDRAGAQPGASLNLAIRTACDRIAPVWPLSHFVAVNPFLGFAGMPFERAAQELGRLTGARLLMPRDFYRQAIREGHVAEADTAAACAMARTGGLSPDRLLHAVTSRAPRPLAANRVATVADVLDGLSAGDRQVSRTAFMVDEISKWCAAYFDQGQAAWRAPWRELPPYAAWRWAVRFDGNAAAMGIEGLAETVASLPADPADAVARVLAALAIPAGQWADYLYRALYDIRGWAAYVRRLDWEAELVGARGRCLEELLAIRVVWGYALFQQRKDDAFVVAWRAALANAWRAPAEPAADDDLAVDLVLHRAFEHATQRKLIAQLAEKRPHAEPTRPPLQAVFCIDVRSEVYRRCLESAWPEAETFGFAGFFGMALAYAEGGGEGEAHCPVLLQPTIAVEAGATSNTAALKHARSLWAQLKQSAVSCFAFVEAFGIGYGVKLALAARGSPSRRAPPAPPLIAPGLDLDRRIDLAESALRGMSLTDGFAQLILLVGHGASTVNNPHGAGLDCGACGGHSGAPNARFAAALLNDPDVRLGLALRRIDIPSDTHFAPALHDTTTDKVWLLDQDAVPATHGPELVLAAARLDAASALARAERAPLLGLAPDKQAAVVARSGDWSQVRPEWGLARASAFIAAPRAVTRGKPLAGRAFLHSYDRTADADLKVLELIMTAPMIVASWISLQYYGSTVDNAAFGAGDKTLHNVCGRIGVLEGNGGDLRTGLPLQSVHDGGDFVHEPVRLNVFLAAHPDCISTVLARQPKVRELVDNGWLFLFALDDQGRTTHRYAGDLSWEAI